MMRHGHVRKLLYEYLTDELDAVVKSRVEAHLASCAGCTRELDEMRTVTDLLARGETRPSDWRSTEYWNMFASQVELQVREGRQKRIVSFSPRIILGRVLFLFARKPVAFGGLATSLAVVVALLLAGRSAPPPVEAVESPQQTVATEDSSIIAVDRLHNYFSRSKVLLVGLTNMRTDEDEPIDLSAERKASRELIHEARYLQSKPLDGRSARLIGDLEKILVELANMKEQGGAPNVEILRGGIHQENLLFKIRMAETLYDTARIFQADKLY